MKIAVYARKSVYSDRSDSIKNQIEMCRNYVDYKYQNEIECFYTYSDEGLSGANTDRPGLQSLMSDMKDGLFDCVVVYQLDRISRDIRDFANIYAGMSENGVKFVSITENIDTSSAIGEAMMYVIAIFAQMERKNIANRVTDNMKGLAKRGYWAGGMPPVGYKKDRVVIDGKKHCILLPDEEGVKYVNWIFDIFIESGRSLQQMETYFKREGIKTRNGNFFSTNQIHKILTMPFCAPATAEVYDFYKNKGCKIEESRETWDGTTGVMIYGRTTEKRHKHQLAAPEDWVVVKGIHEPFMSAEKWLKAQAQLARNKFEKKNKYDIPLLKGPLRCKCGSMMQVARRKKNNGVSSWYYCLVRMRKGIEYCDMSQIKIEHLDNKIYDIFGQIQRDPNVLYNYIDVDEDAVCNIDTKKQKADITKCENKIEKLASSLAFASNSTASKYIISEIEKADMELQELKRKLAEVEIENLRNEKKRKSREDRFNEIIELLKDFDTFNAEEKNRIVKSVIQELVWDGETLFIKM